MTSFKIVQNTYTLSLASYTGEVKMTKSLSVKFGNRLYRIRKEKKLTQLELAERINVSSDFIGLMERGVNSPSFKTLEKLSNVLEVPVYQFFHFDDDIDL